MKNEVDKIFLFIELFLMSKLFIKIAQGVI